MEIKTKTRFDQQVDNWVGEAVTNGARSLDEVVCALPGVYPTVVAASIRRLQLGQFIESTFGGRLNHSIPEKVRDARPRFSIAHQLPIPHPLDYDWRFTVDTANRITRVCAHLGKRLLCLGTPSVFVRAKRGRHFLSSQLLDNNAEMVRHLQVKYSGVHQHDISRSALPKIAPADVVAIDPPWYFEDLQEFTWFASKQCAKGGYLVMCLPSEGTRPNVNDELRDLLRIAKSYGFSMHLEKPNWLRYQTPPFERNALLTAGVEVRSDWRKGSLWILRKEQSHEMPRPIRQFIPQEEWWESSVFGTRIRFKRQTQNGFGDPTLTSIIDGDVLSSVSRRNRMREFVDVWTSGNRVFACCGTGILHQVATAIQLDQDVTSFVQSQSKVSLGSRQIGLIDHAAAQIKRIAILESKERSMANYIGQG